MMSLSQEKAESITPVPTFPLRYGSSHPPRRPSPSGLRRTTARTLGASVRCLPPRPPLQQTASAGASLPGHRPSRQNSSSEEESGLGLGDHVAFGIADGHDDGCRLSFVCEVVD